MSVWVLIYKADCDGLVVNYKGDLVEKDVLIGTGEGIAGMDNVVGIWPGTFEKVLTT